MSANDLFAAAEQQFPTANRPAWADQIVQSVQELQQSSQRSAQELQRSAQELQRELRQGLRSLDARLSNQRLRAFNLGQVQSYRLRQIPGRLQPLIRERSVAPDGAQQVLDRLWGRGRHRPVFADSLPGEVPQDFPASVQDLLQISRHEVLSLAVFYNDLFDLHDNDDDALIREKLERFICT